MPPRHALIFAALLGLFSTGALAGTNHVPGGPRISDCNKARDPAQCEARVAARTACQHKSGSAKRQCMDARRVTPECIKADNPVSCSQTQRVAYICRNKKGKAHTQCTQTELNKFSARL